MARIYDRTMNLKFLAAKCSLETLRNKQTPSDSVGVNKPRHLNC